MIDLKIKYMHEDTKRLTINDIGNWIDVYADDDYILRKGEHKYIKLGFAMELPKGYEALVAPRSSTYKNWHIIMANSIGVIDTSYCGDDDEWHASVICLDTTDGFIMTGEEYIAINRGDKIAQFRIIESMPPVNLIEVEHLGNKNRGGLGSTGKN